MPKRVGKKLAKNASSVKSKKQQKTTQPTRQSSLSSRRERLGRLKAAHRKARQQYYTYMPSKKHHRVLIWVVFLLIVTIIALQLSYPPDRALPLARVANQSVAWQDEIQLAKQLTEQFQKTKLTLRAADSTPSMTVPLATVGAEPNTEKMIESVVEYPFWQRFIPLSILLQQPAVRTADVFYTADILAKFSDKTASKLGTAPINARLEVKQGKIVAVDDKPGYIVSADAVHRAIVAAQPVLGETTNLRVGASTTAPERTAADFAAVRRQAEAALARSVTIQAGSKEFTPGTAQIASWLQLSEQDGKTTLIFNRKTLDRYIDTIDTSVGKPAGRTDIRIVNGRETGRQEGMVGRAVDRDALATALDAWLLRGEGSSNITAGFRDVQPSVIFNSKYTPTQEGLRAYASDLAQRSDTRIVIQQLDGQRWSASARGDESTPSASTYKLFVAKKLFTEMQAGRLGWGDPALDTTVSGCFDRMTIASTNPCALAWLAQYGRGNMNQFVRTFGFNGTDFTASDATRTTANDLTKYMIGLENGSLVSEPYRSRLLRSLSTHPYRYGIPTGSQGRVWDKVGFLWDYVHDTAIVYHPKGRYVMTVMTKSQSYGAIAGITREVERIMYP